MSNRDPSFSEILSKDTYRIYESCAFQAIGTRTRHASPIISHSDVYLREGWCIRWIKLIRARERVEVEVVGDAHFDLRSVRYPGTDRCSNCNQARRRGKEGILGTMSHSRNFVCSRRPFVRTRVLGLVFRCINSRIDTRRQRRIGVSAIY